MPLILKIHTWKQHNRTKGTQRSGTSQTLFFIDFAKLKPKVHRFFEHLRDFFPFTKRAAFLLRIKFRSKV